MADTVHCRIHGEREPAFVCIHLAGKTAALGFHRGEPSDDNPFPDAWCDDCELIRSAHDGWTEESEKLASVALICAGCYRLASIRNTRTSPTLDELADLRWKCGSCEDWHTGPILDLAFSEPHFWSDEYDRAHRWTRLPSGVEELTPTFLDSEFCAINDENFFVRGVIPVPILGSLETFCWGVWGSLSRANFEFLITHEDDPAIADRPPMFSWLSSRIPEYPDTLSLRMQVHIQPPGTRPDFHLEKCDHPLAKEQLYGITPERVKEITLRQMPHGSQ
jgi:hypothetical protein